MSVVSECPRCGKHFNGDKGVSTHIGKAHREEIASEIEELYISENMKPSAIAEKLELPPTTVSRYITEFSFRGKDPANYHFPGDTLEKYPMYMGTGVYGKGQHFRVHQLVAIADGADPYKVFSGKWDVDHINGCPVDNRPQNLRLMEKGNHGAKDGEKSEFGHTRKDLLYMMHFAFDSRPFLEAVAD